MLKFKACPRCKGNLIIHQDGGVWYEYCLQCGYDRELKSLVKDYSATGAMPQADSKAMEYEVNKENNDGFSYNHSSGRFIDNKVNLRKNKRKD